MTQMSGRSPATSDSRLSTASPTRNLSGGATRGGAERGSQRVVLGAGTVRESEHRRAQLTQPGERQLHLRLHAGRTRHPARRGRRTRPSEVLQQRRLADARLATHHEDTALTGSDGPDQPFEHVTLSARRSAQSPPGPAAAWDARVPATGG